MEKLFEHTLQRQNRELQTELAEMRTQMAAQSAQLTELSTLVRGQLTLAPRPAETRIDHAAQVNMGQVTNIAQQTIVAIIPWDGDRRIDVGIEAVKAAFAENTRLQEYARLGDRELVDPEIAPPYVTELLMDLTKRAHADPAARNVYLNPRRADQALVHLKTGKWEVLPLAEATRLMFDGVAQGITAVSRTLVSSEERRQLPAEAQNALAMAGLLYDDEPDEYVKRAKGSMAAHLQNTHPESGEP